MQKFDLDSFGWFFFCALTCGIPFVRLDCQSDLSASITKLNSKSKLLVVREAPQTVLVKLFKAWSISHLVFEKDTDAYARDRDREVMRMAKEAGVEVITKVGRTLYDPDELVQANGGKPTMSITAVQHVRLTAQVTAAEVLIAPGQQKACRRSTTDSGAHVPSRPREHLISF